MTILMLPSSVDIVDIVGWDETDTIVDIFSKVHYFWYPEAEELLRTTKPASNSNSEPIRFEQQE